MAPAARARPIMFLLLRLLLIAALLAGLAYGALAWLGVSVRPEPREITIEVPLPKTRP